MSKKGYAFESEIEDFFLKHRDQNKQTPLLKFNLNGILQINRSFRVPNSGAMESIKGDIITAIPWLPKQLKVECKARYTKNKKDGQIMMFEKKWIEKNDIEAKRDNQISVLVFSFKKVQKGRIWWIIRGEDFEYLRFHAMYNMHKRPFPIEVQQSDKTFKFVHKEMIKLDTEDTLYLLTDERYKKDIPFYYVLSHEMFDKLMVRFKDVQ